METPPPVTPDFDVAIVGGGPAGIATAIGITSEGPRVVVLNRNDIGGPIKNSSLIENVFGVGVGGKTGEELMGSAINQAAHFGTEFRSPFDAVRLLKDPKTGIFTIRGNNHEQVTAKVVVLALGASPRRMDTPGIAEYHGRGVSYTAPEYTLPARWANKKVGIVGAGNGAGQAALFLSRCPDCSVTVFVRGDGLERGMSRFLYERIMAANIVVHPRSSLLRVSGVDSRLTTVRYKVGDLEEELCLDHLLIQIGAEPPTGWLQDDVVVDAKGFIPTDRDLPEGTWPADLGRDPFRFEASLPGVFVAGDVHAGTPGRMSCAIGEGHALAVSVYSYLLFLHDSANR